MTPARTRLLSALVLVPPVLGLVLLVPADAAAAVCALPLVLAVEEWGRLSGFGRPVAVLVAALVAAFLAVSLLTLEPRGGSFLAGGLGLLVDGVFAALLFGTDRVRCPSSLTLVLGVVSLAVLWWTAFALFREGSDGRGALLSLLVLVWAADSAAYLVGRRWGRRALAPRVSPGKTWEGALGGLVATLLAATLLRAGGSLGHAGLPFALVLGLAVWAAALLGDLAESQLKRRRGVKDSGTLIPGHGGLLDRIDGLMAAAPVFYCFWCLKGAGGW